MNTSNVDSYLVRIYRRKPEPMVGVVESAESEEKCSLFHSFAELESILAREDGADAAGTRDIG